mmetsp:Transcript_50667/g.162164  ORF Transcript_50667/g.162164 Transcript_50667/m.162164 type:complete len:107 (+) Transcript_50667:131-451(+)
MSDAKGSGLEAFKPTAPAVHTVIHRMVCFMILLGAAGTYWISDYFLILLVFVALNFLQSTFSWGICPPSIAMGMLGWTAIDPAEPLQPRKRVYFFKSGLPPAGSAV